MVGRGGRGEESSEDVGDNCCLGDDSLPGDN